MIKKIIFIGFGSIGQRHYANLSCCFKNLDVKTYIGENKTKINKRPNNKFREERINIISSKQNLIKELKCLLPGDIVFICSRSSEHILHLELTSENVKDNILIIVEKPLATDLLELKKIHSLKLRKNIFVISQFRCSSVFSQLKNFIENNIFGDLISFSFINHESIKNWHPWENYKDSYSTNKHYGGGCLFTQIHDLEILYGLMGLPNKSHFFFGDGKNLDIDVDDYYCASLVYKKNKDIFGTITSSYYSNIKPRIHSFTFENALVVWDLNKDELEINSKKTKNLKSLNRNDLFLKLSKNIINISENLKVNKYFLNKYNSGLVTLEDSIILHEWLLINTLD